ncbi:hypothetical protein C0J45_23738, partial [Silurus meridionalis]
SLPDCYGQSLISSASVVKRPGESVTVSCTVSGFKDTNKNMLTHWIRQPAGKTLEWIGYMGYGGSTGDSDKLKNKFSFSRDTSTNTLTIRGQNMQTEDTAVYYCA